MNIEARLEELFPSEELQHFRARSALPDLPLVAPRCEERVGELLKAAAQEGWKLVVLGGGSTLARSPFPAGADAVLSLAGLSGVTAYEPQDGTLSALAGTTMAQLEETVHAGGHHLSPEVARPEVATLGGVVASASSGFERLRFGAVRENVLGMRVALCNGSVVKSGGRLVKNVTGYDLHRLFCGSNGTLGVICEVSMRLYPLPEATRLLTSIYPRREEAMAKARESFELPISPLAIAVSDLADGGGHLLEIFLAGRSEVLAWATEWLNERVGELNTAPAEATRERRHILRDDVQAPLRFHCRPSRLEETVTTIERCAEAQGQEARFLLNPALAEGSARFSNPANLEQLVAALGGTRLSATLLWTGTFPTPNPGPGRWMEKLRAALDPTGVFASHYSPLT